MSKTIELKADHFILLVFIFILILCPTFAFADSWAPPSTWEQYSPNKKYKFVVIPKPISLETPDYPRGELYKCGQAGECSAIWKVRLINDVSPTYAIVADTGKYVVTFDNWYSVGYGDDVVVVYGEHGKLLYKYALGDFMTRQEIKRDVTVTISSMFWRQDRPYLIEGEEILILPTKAGIRRISLKDGSVKMGEL